MTTPILDLEEWAESQAQPQITVNTALRWLEAFAQLSVFSQSSMAPPPSPSDGALYIVPDGATGEWAGHDGQIALYLSTAWAYKTAPPGSMAYVQDEDAYFKYAPGSPATWDPV